MLEPAAFGAPVLFGPRHANAREAAELIAASGAFESADESVLRDRLRMLIDDAGQCRHAGSAARAAERGAEIVEGLLRG